VGLGVACTILVFVVLGGAGALIWAEDKRIEKLRSIREGRRSSCSFSCYGVQRLLGSMCQQKLAALKTFIHSTWGLFVYRFYLDL